MRRTAIVLTIGCAALGLTACNSTPGTPSAGATATSAPATEPASTPADEPLETPTATPEHITLAVTTATVKGVTGRIVTVNGWSAYRFEADSNKPPKITCLYDCLVTWPPVLSDGSAPEVTGINKTLVSTVKRPDGLEQVTLNGWPLYKFKEDKVRADVKGEGVGGNWSAVKADGKPLISKRPGGNGPLGG